MKSYRATPPTVLPTPVPYDPDLLEGLEAFVELVEKVPLRPDTIEENRQHLQAITQSIEAQTAGRQVSWEDHTIPGPAGAPDVVVTVITPSGSRDSPHPAVLGIHGGGYVLGTRFFGTAELIDLAERFGTVGVAVEYRLAPEAPAPAAAEDCYAALVWMARNADRLNIDPHRIVVSGASAGGGLAAAVALMARDRTAVHLAGQLLVCPMINDKNDTTSSWQYDGIGAWDRNNNDAGWDAYLAELRGTSSVHPYQAPLRETNYTGLAPAYLEVGSADIFRDETTQYASRIWAAGGSAELHIWSGGYHGFNGFSPEAIVSQATNAARDSWWRRTLGIDEG